MLASQLNHRATHLCVQRSGEAHEASMRGPRIITRGTINLFPCGELYVLEVSHGDPACSARTGDGTHLARAVLGCTGACCHTDADSDGDGYAGSDGHTDQRREHSDPGYRSRPQC